MSVLGKEVMRKIIITFSACVFYCLFAFTLLGQSKPDTCEVIFVDQQAANKVLGSLTANTTREEMEEKTKAAVQILGRFPRAEGEEALTNKSFPIPDTNLIATASVMYTDFHQQSFLRGHPPKVIWVRLGNCSTSDVEALLRKYAKDIEEFHGDEVESLLVLS